MRTIRIIIGAVALTMAVGMTADAAESVPGGQPEIEVFSVTSCRTNQFCMWEKTNHEGNLVEKSGTGVSRALINPVRSVWNNRPYAAKLYNQAGNAFKCIAPGKKLNITETSYQKPSSVWLAAGTSC